MTERDLQIATDVIKAWRQSNNIWQAAQVVADAFAATSTNRCEGCRWPDCPPCVLDVHRPTSFADDLDPR